MEYFIAIASEPFPSFARQGQPHHHLIPVPPHPGPAGKDHGPDNTQRLFGLYADRFLKLQHKIVSETYHAKRWFIYPYLASGL